MTLLVIYLNLTYSVVGKFLPMKYGSSLLHSHISQWDFVRCSTQGDENNTRIVMCKIVDSRVALVVS